MDARCAALCATLLAAFGGPVLAASHWICGVSTEGTRLVCVADADPADPADPADDRGAGRAGPSAVVNGTRFPLDRSQVYTVDMWSPPTEADFVMRLAQATICYRSPGCQVSLVPGPWLAAARTHARR